MPIAARSAARKLPLLQSLRNHFLRGLPDLLGIVLDPSRLRIDLLVLLLRDRHDLAGCVKHAEARAGCALIDCADVVSHGGYGNGGCGMGKEQMRSW